MALPFLACSSSGTNPRERVPNGHQGSASRSLGNYCPSCCPWGVQGPASPGVITPNWRQRHQGAALLCSAPHPELLLLLVLVSQLWKRLQSSFRAGLRMGSSSSHLPELWVIAQLGELAPGSGSSEQRGIVLGAPLAGKDSSTDVLQGLTHPRRYLGSPQLPQQWHCLTRSLALISSCFWLLAG